MHGSFREFLQTQSLSVDPWCWWRLVEDGECGGELFVEVVRASTVLPERSVCHINSLVRCRARVTDGWPTLSRRLNVWSD